MRHAFFDGLRPTLHIAHRGGAALAPENTMVAFRAAVEVWHTDMLELDVHRSRDGELVVHHDPDLDRCTNGRGPLAERTWAELEDLDAGWHHPAHRGAGLRLPRLVEVLEAFPRTRLNVELKASDPALVTDFVRLLRQRGEVDRVCCGSEIDDVGEALRAALPEGCHFLPRGALTAWVTGALQGASPAAPAGYHVVDMPMTWQGMNLVNDRLVSAADRAGLWVNVWTVDEEPDMERLRDLGVGGIMTDRPDRLRRVLGPGPGRQGSPDGLAGRDRRPLSP